MAEASSPARRARSAAWPDLLSPNPARRAVEAYWLKYTLVWGSIAAVIMIGGVATRWGDVELMLLGALFAAGAVLPPVLRPHPRQAGLVWHRRTAFKLSAAVIGFSFLMNYFCTPFFFDVLHMHFGFHATITIQNNPVFLYLMTVAYFATYLVLVCAGFRLVRRRLSGRWRLAGAVLAPLAVAALETALNANPFMTSLFCFDDMPFMLWFGTLSYGACFVFALPVWAHIDERADEPTPLARVLAGVLAAMMLIVITFEVLRYHVAPHVTTVAPRMDGAPRGLRDFDTSCLVPAE